MTDQPTTPATDALRELRDRRVAALCGPAILDQPAGEFPPVDAVLRAVVAPDRSHRYVSTCCVHGQHADCRRTCKGCENPCLCRCHN